MPLAHVCVATVSPRWRPRYVACVGSERDVADSYSQATCMQVQCGRQHRRAATQQKRHTEAIKTGTEVSEVGTWQ